MTKREMFTAIAEKVADNTEMVEFLNHQIELLDNSRSAKKGLTPTQKANVEVKETILVNLARFEEPITVTELLNHGSGLEGFTNQKISALIGQLVKEGKVRKGNVGRKSVFSLAETAE